MLNKRLKLPELEVLDAVVREAPAEIGAVVRQQVSEVNLVQRFADGGEVNLYRMRLRLFPREFSVSFPNRSDLCLAEVSLEQDGVGLIATVWVVGGSVFSIRFSRTPSVQMAAKNIKVTLIDDPRQEEVGKTRADTVALAKLLGVAHRDILSAEGPMARGQRQHRARLHGSEFPDDWSQMVRLCDGFQLRDGVRVFGLGNLTSATFPKIRFLVLAEGIEDRFLCLRCGPPDTDLVVVDHEGQVISEHGQCFSDALNQYRESGLMGKG